MNNYAELRAAVDAGPTPGPWRSHEHGVGEFLVYRYNPILDQVAVVFINQDIRYETGSMDQRGLDVAYIAAAHPEAIRALLAERDALREAAQAALAYDSAIQSCANDPNAMSSFCTAVGDDLDTLYEAWITKSRAALAQGEA